MEKVLLTIGNFWEEYQFFIKFYGCIFAFVLLFVYPWLVGWYHIIF